VVHGPDRACCLFSSVQCCWHTATFIQFFVVRVCFCVLQRQGAVTDAVRPFMYFYMTQVFTIWPFTKKHLLTPVIKEHVHHSSNTKSNIKKTNILSFIVFPHINSIVKCQWKWNSSPEHLKANFIPTELGNYWPKNEMIMRKWRYSVIKIMPHLPIIVTFVFFLFVIKLKRLCFFLDFILWERDKCHLGFIFSKAT